MPFWLNPVMNAIAFMQWLLWAYRLCISHSDQWSSCSPSIALVQDAPFKLIRLLVFLHLSSLAWFSLGLCFYGAELSLIQLSMIILLFISEALSMAHGGRVITVVEHFWRNGRYSSVYIEPFLGFVHLCSVISLLTELAWEDHEKITVRSRSHSDNRG